MRILAYGILSQLGLSLLTPTMSSAKRKEAPGGQPSPKASKKSREAGPSKKDAAAKPAKSNASKEPSEPAAPTHVVSVLKDEEPMFPRGGANVLTPLEQKQIQVEAKADARREEEFNVSQSSSRKKKSKRAEKSSSKTEKMPAEDVVKVESLNFKVSKANIGIGSCHSCRTETG